MATFCFLGPELLFAIAVGQWQSAQRSVRNFHASGYQNWTIRHAFFANMGGFILRTRDFKPFPLDAEQLHYLVINNYLPYPQIDKETINDKNKVDSVARVITIVQVLWFVLNSIGRLVQHLELTTGELSTLGFILCTLGSTFCWAKKPSDVYRAIILETEVTMVHILCSAGDKARAPYRNSPLDFVNREEWLWNRCWTYWLNMLGAMHIRTFSRTLKVRPINRIPNDRFQKIDEGGLFLVFLLSLCYGALFVCGWNFSFPTKIERDLWRIASVTNIGIIFISYFFETLFLSTLPVLRGEEDTSRSLAKQDVESGPGKRCLSTSFPRRQAKSLAEKLRNNSPDNDPQLAMQLRTILPLLSASMLYFLARAYVLIEDLLELRALPPSAFQTVNWSAFWPHI